MKKIIYAFILGLSIAVVDFWLYAELRDIVAQWLAFDTPSWKISVPVKTLTGVLSGVALFWAYRRNCPGTALLAGYLSFLIVAAGFHNFIEPGEALFCGEHACQLAFLDAIASTGSLVAGAMLAKRLWPIPRQRA